MRELAKGNEEGGKKEEVAGGEGESQHCIQAPRPPCGSCPDPAGARTTKTGGGTQKRGRVSLGAKKKKKGIIKERRTPGKATKGERANAKRGRAK